MYFIVYKFKVLNLVHFQRIITIKKCSDNFSITDRFYEHRVESI